MAKTRVTLTLDSEQLDELRRAAGARALSATVDRAVSDYLIRVRHFAAVDEWLDEMEHEDGPVPADVQAWADQVVREWEASTTS